MIFKYKYITFKEVNVINNNFRYNPTGYLQYGFSKFCTDEIQSIQKGYILVPQGESWQEQQAREAADKIVEYIGKKDKADYVKYYAMFCDAVHSDFPDSPVKTLKDKNDIPIRATHIIGNYGAKLAVVPNALASYEDVIKSVAQSLDDFPNIIDITK